MVSMLRVDRQQPLFDGRIVKPADFDPVPGRDMAQRKPEIADGIRYAAVFGFIASLKQKSFLRHRGFLQIAIMPQKSKRSHRTHRVYF